MSGRGNYCQKSANILKHLFKRHNYLDLFQHFSLSDTGYTATNIEGLEQTVATGLCSDWHSTKKNILEFFWLGIQPCDSRRLQGLRYMHRVIIPLVPGLLYTLIIIINAQFNRWLEPVQFLLWGTEYGCIISNVELKVEMQHQVMLLIQNRLIYHFYSFLSLSELKCLR